MNKGKLPEILSFLGKDLHSNINVINFLENYTPSFIKLEGDAAVVKGKSDRDWVYISAKSKTSVKGMMKYITDDDKAFAAIEDTMVPVIAGEKKIKWRLSCVRLIMERNRFTNNPLLDSLKGEDAVFVFENSDYREYLSTGYILDRINHGVSSVIRIGGVPAAWGMTHDDGAIGFLHVLPQYRGKSLGKNVAIDMIQKVIGKKKLPFVHIEEENFRSMNLALSLGFEKDKTVNWFEIE
ncbi:MAG: GNAT family N-acetyltransferase [Bacteroidetes bacterium]|nr:GNAT family N-acetyltransferase [Bacteroidota bacterium]